MIERRVFRLASVRMGFSFAGKPALFAAIQLLACRLLLLAALLPTTTTAADHVGLLGARLPIEYRYWKLHSDEGQETVSQFHVPLVATMRVDAATSVVFSAGGARSSLTGESGDHRLVGASDVEVQAYHRIRSRGLVLVGGIRIPSGKRELDEDELDVARTLSNPLLGMRVTQYGRGLDLNAGLVWARPVGRDTSLGIGAGIKLPGSYEQSQRDESYQPTRELSMSVGLERSSPRWVPRPRAFKIQSTYRIFGTDRLGSRDIFREGNQLDIEAQTSQPLGPLRFELLQQVTIKEASTSYGEEGDEVQTRTLDSGVGTGTEIELRFPLRSRLYLAAVSTIRTLEASDLPGRDGSALEIGPTVGFDVGSRGWFAAGFRFATGKSRGTSGTTDLDGYSVAVSGGVRPRI